MFKAERTQAHIDPIQNKIYPATLKVLFNPLAAKRTEEMVSNISNHTGYKIESIEQSLANLIYHLSSEIRVRNEVFFEPFGKLFYTKLNDVLQFETANKNLHQQFYNQKEYSLPADLTKKAAPFIQSTYTTNPNTSKSFYRNLLVLTSLLWLLFLGLLLCPSKKPTEQKILPASIDSQILHSDTIKEKLNSIPDTQQIQKNITADSSTSTTELKNEEVIKESNIKKLDKKIRSKKCIIIVGSFKNKINAEKLIKKIKKHNYTSYLEKNGDFYRAGIKFDCMKKNLHLVHKDLKRNFAKDAWILKW